jgi:acetyltransferase-like isoleucine patch superfamily enzyme
MARSIAPKVSTTRRGRILRLIASILDPRAIAHMIKVQNYYNYTHVAQLRRATLGRGVAISPTASFANAHNLVIGDHVHIGANCTLWAGHGTARILVGEHALFAPGVMITAANYRFNDGAPVSRQLMNEADVVIGRDVWLGYGCVVLPGVTVGDGAILGAGTVVREDVPPRAIVAGNPAAVVGHRRAPGKEAGA